MGLVAVMVAIAADYVSKVPGLETANARFNFGLYLCSASPSSHLLSFCGDAEESEVDAMLFCGTSGSRLAPDRNRGRLRRTGRDTSYLIPLVLFFVYTTRVMPSASSSTFARLQLHERRSDASITPVLQPGPRVDPRS